MKDCIPGEEPHAVARKEHEKERAAEKKSYKMTVTPILHPPMLLRGKEVEELGVKISLARWWGENRVRVEGGFSFGFISY